MAVPDYIRKVPRPVNTIVVDNGRDGPNRYAVRERIGTRYIPGGNPQPRNGKVIGHIRDGKFVSKQEPSSVTGPDMLSYGASAFVKSVSRDLLDDLMDVYPIAVYRQRKTFFRIQPHFRLQGLPRNWDVSQYHIRFPAAAWTRRKETPSVLSKTCRTSSG